ncbi:MAG TPA: hypothetical protein P5342_03040 [Candidatus Cloacimonadota bacterium]|nr:hypothetical protein [Candidatus Cloacimonadota bacterium]
MVFSYYLLQPIYSTAWHLLNLLQKRRETVFYCHTPVDLEIWLPVQKYLKPIPIATDKRDTYKFLKSKGFQVRRLPVFPKAVIMCRVSAHKFPCRSIIKIGMMHGAYHFKRRTSAKNYLPFSLYMFSSQKDLDNAIEIGVTCGKVGGYPKLDPFLPPKQVTRTNPAKPKLLFTATYDSSSMSGIERWIDRLPELVQQYDIAVSVHPWTNSEYIKRLRTMPGITYIEDNPLHHIPAADVCIVDTSSIIAEICALDKPMISWKLPAARRSVPEVYDIIAATSIQIDSFEELVPALDRALAEPAALALERQKANAIFFDRLDGKAGERCAGHITLLLPELGL